MFANYLFQNNTQFKSPWFQDAGDKGREENFSPAHHGSHLDKMAIARDSAPAHASHPTPPPVSYLLFYHRSSHPSSSNGKIMVTNMLSHRQLSAALTEWIGVIIPVTESSIYKLGGYSSSGSIARDLNFLCVKFTGSSERMTVPLIFPFIIFFFDLSPKLPKSQ